MKGKIDKLIINPKTALIPLNFFNAIPSPFTRGQGNVTTEMESEHPLAVSCSILKSNDILPKIWYKNISPIYYEKT